VGRAGSTGCSYIGIRNRSRFSRNCVYLARGDTVEHDRLQASGRGGGGERFDVVVVLEHGAVEKRIEEESDDIDVQAMGRFLIWSGCRTVRSVGARACY
jgi:hypothetical protein